MMNGVDGSSTCFTVRTVCGPFPATPLCLKPTCTHWTESQQPSQSADVESQPSTPCYGALGTDVSLQAGSRPLHCQEDAFSTRQGGMATIFMAFHGRPHAHIHAYSHVPMCRHRAAPQTLSCCPVSTFNLFLVSPSTTSRATTRHRLISSTLHGESSWIASLSFRCTATCAPNLLLRLTFHPI